MNFCLVSTASLSACLGLATLLASPQLAYPTHQNLLADIRYQRPRSGVYPTGLWTTHNEVRAGGPAAALPAP